MNYLPLILVSIILVSGCVAYTDKNNTTDTTIADNKTQECLTNSDCIPTGCSSQLCAPKGSDLVTTCEWRPEYDCLQLTSCGCVENKCAWEENPEYSSCLESPPNKDMGPVF